MRRVLCFVCVCIVILCALRLFLRRADGPPVFMREDKEYLFHGIIWQRENDSIYIHAISFRELLPEEQSSKKQIYDLKPNGGMVNCRKNMSVLCKLKDVEEFTESAETVNALLPGSRMVFRAKTESFSSATNPGEFDTKAYYDSLMICGRLKGVKVLSLEKPVLGIREKLYRLRCKLEKRLYRVFGAKDAAVLGALLLGDKENLDSEVRDLYQRNGMIHILSISGLHISLLGMGVYKLLRKIGLPIRGAAILGCFFMVTYGYMTGMGISAKRAIGMYLISMAAVMLGRSYDLMTALAVMAALMTLENPKLLTHAGFLLSFGSVCGIGLLLPCLQNTDRPAVMSHQKVQALKNSIWTGVSVTLFTLPVQLWFYYEVPIYGVALNVLILPFMGLLFTGGMLTAFVPGLGKFSVLVSLLLRYFESLCLLTERLPVHSINPGKPQIWQMIGYYGMLFSGMLFLRRGSGKSTAKKTAAFTAVTLAVFCLTFHPYRETTITFLDVGQGDCACVQLRTGEVFLIDCGSTGRKQVGTQVLIPFLKEQGIRKIEGVFVSHGDKDHMSGVAELFQNAAEERIRVKQLYVPAGRPVSEGEYEILYAAAAEYQKAESFRVIQIKAGDTLQYPNCRILCLHPTKGTELTDSNEASMCLWFGMDSLQVLFTGDVEGRGEEELMKQMKRYGIQGADILKVAHHGSRYASSEAFTDAYRFTVGVISAGRNNSYGHPHEETLTRFAKQKVRLFRTDEKGAVIVHPTKKGFRISTFVNAYSFNTDTIRISTLMVSFRRPVLMPSSASTQRRTAFFN